MPAKVSPLAGEGHAIARFGVATAKREEFLVVLGG